MYPCWEILQNKSSCTNGLLASCAFNALHIPAYESFKLWSGFPAKMKKLVSAKSFTFSFKAINQYSSSLHFPMLLFIYHRRNKVLHLPVNHFFQQLLIYFYALKEVYNWYILIQITSAVVFVYISTIFHSRVWRVWNHCLFGLDIRN